MDAARLEAAREVFLSMEIGDSWESAIEPGLPDWMKLQFNETVGAFRNGNIELLVSGLHPEFVMSQPEALPDARTYHGAEGYIDAILDWPKEWKDFAVEPKRIFAPDQHHLVIDAMHSGRSLAMDIDIEVEIFWLLEYEDQLPRRWQMFLTLDDTLQAAGAAD